MKKYSLKLKIAFALVFVFLLAALIIFICIRIKTHNEIYKEYATYGDIKITNIGYRYYFRQYADAFIEKDLSVIDYIGLQPEIDYSKQIHDKETGETWEEFFEKKTVETLKEVAVMLAAAHEQGFTLSDEEEDAYLKRAKAEMQDNAKSHSLTLNQYISQKYVSGATFNDMKEVLLDEALYKKYKQSLYDDIVLSEDEINAYFNEHFERYNLITYRSCLLSTTEYMNSIAYDADDSSVNEDELTKNLIKEAKEKVLKDAQYIMDNTDSPQKFEEFAHTYSHKQALEEYKDEDISLKEKQAYEDCIEVYRDWLFSKDRKKGDMAVIYSNVGETAYVLYYLKSDPNVSKKRTYYQIFRPYEQSNPAMGPSDEEKERSIKETEALYKEICEKCKNNVEEFKKYADEYNKDQGTIASHGYKKEIVETKLTSAQKEWLVSDSRKAGDIGLVNDLVGSYIYYYDEESEPSWHDNAKNDCKTEIYKKKLAELREKYGVKEETND